MLVTSLVHVAVLGCSAAPPGTSPGPISTGSAASAGPTATAEARSGASWAESALAAIRVDKGDAGGMRGCTGTLTPEARAFFVGVYSASSTCVAAAPSVKGLVTFHSTIEEGGGLSEFSVMDDQLGAPDVVKCIQEKVFSTEFPKVDPKTPCVQLVHPMRFP